MSQIPPMSPPPPAYLPPAPKQGNIAAMVSLIAGILSCIPGVSVIAVVLGIVGLIKAGKPNVGGKGLAIAGLILGIIGLAWTGGAAFVFIKAKTMYAEGKPAMASAKQFALDVGRADADAAIKDCSASMSADKVRSLVTQSQSWGALQDQTTVLVPIKFDDHNGLKTVTVAGAATFANVKKTYQATLDEEDGAYRVTDFTFADQK